MSHQTPFLVTRRYAHFVATACIACAATLTAYVAAVEFSVPDPAMPTMYKSFLVSEVPGPRLIIDSGSNSHHSLSANMIQEALGLTTINIADNAGYDIEAKVARLAAETSPGDTVLLPLEWSYYTRDLLTDDFVDTLFSSGSDYYRALSPLGKIRLALTIPPQNTFAALSGHGKAPQQPGEMSMAQLLHMAAIQSPNGSASNDQPRALQEGVADSSCDSYAFGKDLEKGPLNVSAKMKRALASLKTLRESGVDIHFAWPVLAGDACMKSDTAIAAFREEIKTTVESYGFQFVGTASDSLYPLSMRDDTPYHLIKEGTEIHTTKMIDFLKAAGVEGSGTGLDVREFAMTRIYELEAKTGAQAKIAQLPVNTLVPVNSDSADVPFRFGAGWWPADEYGHLMRGNQATIGLSLPEDAPDGSKIILTGGGTGAGDYRVKISSAGQLLTEADFTTPGVIQIPADTLPRGENITLHMELAGAPAPTSPKDRGENEDTRTMTLRLASIGFGDESIVPVAPPVEPALPPESPISDPSEPAMSNAPLVSQSEAQTPIVLATGAVQSGVGFQVNPALFDPEKCITIAESEAELVPLPFGIPIEVGKLASAGVVYFGEGWWGRERGGRWMEGSQAQFSFLLPDGAEPGAFIRLYGDVFQGPSQKVEFYFDDALIMTGDIANGVPLDINLDAMPRGTPVAITMRLPDVAVTSPAAQNLGPDTRTLTGFLSSVELKSEDPRNIILGALDKPIQ